MTPSDIDAMEADLRALRALQQSRGWEIVRKAIQDDILKAAFSMSENPNMPEKERDFRCGAMAAARGALQVVPALVQRMENDLLLASVNADALTSNAKA